MPKWNSWAERVADSGAVASIGAGSVVLIGWALNWWPSCGIGSISLAMTCDSAIAFLLAGLCILAIRARRPVAAKVLSWSLVALGGGRFLTDLNEVWSSVHGRAADLMSGTANAGAVSSLQTTCAASILVILLGCALCILRNDRISTSRIRLAALCITGLVIGGSVGLLAAITGLSTDPIWVQSSLEMPVGAAICAMLGAGALLGLLFWKSGDSPGVRIPFVATEVGGLSLLLVWALTQSTGVLYAQIAAQTRAAIVSTSAQVVAVYAVTSCVRSVEGSEQGYLLTQNQVYLDDYRAGLTAVKPALKGLSVFGERRGACSKLEVLTAGKLLELGETIALQQAGRRQEALAIVRSDLGRRFMSGIDNERDQLVRQLKSDLTVELASDSKFLRLMRETILLAYGLALLMAGLGVVLIRKEFQYRIRVEAALRESGGCWVAGGEAYRRTHSRPGLRV